MTNPLTNISSFGNDVKVVFDRFADLYVIELKVENSKQQVIATEVDMKQFIGVYTAGCFRLHILKIICIVAILLEYVSH